MSTGTEKKPSIEAQDSQTYLQIEAGIYRYKDKEGKITYHERPSVNGKRTYRSLGYNFTAQHNIKMAREQSGEALYVFVGGSVGDVARVVEVVSESFGDFVFQCISHILRGIRSESDYEFERTMRNINGDFDLGICTVFLMPPRNIAQVSSSMIKKLIGPRGWQRVVRKYIPQPVYQHILKKHG
jgi:phosphopantetheine adenylyltransferase